MSDIPKTAEETPVASTEATSAPVTDTPEIHSTALPVPATASTGTETTAAAAQPTETSSGLAGTEPAAGTERPYTEHTLSDGNAAIEASAAAEGVLGYKAPGLLKSFRFVDHHFWFGNDALTPEALATYLRNEKAEVAHHNAAWAQENGKGVLFYSKRAEDKGTPGGLIMLHDASNIVKEGEKEFSFKTGSHSHRFKAPTISERDSWIVAIETKIEEAKGLKDGIVGSEGYKKNLNSYTNSPALVGSNAPAAPTTHHGEEAAAGGVAAVGAGAVAATGIEKKHEESPVEQKRDVGASKSRSQSRKRNSIFGAFLGKKEEKDEQKEWKKEEKAEEKAEKKHEKEVVKEHKAEEKTIEHDHLAAVKKEEKAEHKAEEKAEKQHLQEEKKLEAEAKQEEGRKTEAAEAAAVAAVPAAAIGAEKKHDKDEAKINGTTSTTDKKSKRASVFGSLFARKESTEPTTKHTDREVGPVVPSKDTDVLPVTATAPKIDEPIVNQPIDTTAVIAPVDAESTPTAVDEPTETPATATTPKTEKKGGLLGFIKKQELKSEAKKEEKAADTVHADPVAAASVDPLASSAETPATAAVTGDERATREKRRTSVFDSLSAPKRKTANTSSETDGVAATEGKREKSPLPQRVASIFRRNKGVKPTEEKTTANASSEASHLPETESTPAATTKGTSAAVEGDSLPNGIEGTVHDAVTAQPNTEVSATA